jgi:glycosyltransferase involved in cell wall biosynthesis
MNTFFGYLNRVLFRSADRIVVLGRDMKALVEKRIGTVGKHIRIIRSWADTDVVVPAFKKDNSLLKELGLTDKFVVTCVGNMGRAQAIPFIFEAISHLKHDDSIHFLFIGSGSRKTWMESEIESRGLRNITIVGQRPRTEQSSFLNACDISIISLLPGVTGAGVPSRTYNLMAAGKPIIAVTREDSEVSLLVQEENIGWVVPPVDAANLVQAILDARSDADRICQMGVRANAAAKEKFTRERIIDEYRYLINEMRALCPAERRTYRRRLLDECRFLFRNQ